MQSFSPLDSKLREVFKVTHRWTKYFPLLIQIVIFLTHMFYSVKAEEEFLQIFITLT